MPDTNPTDRTVITFPEEYNEIMTFSLKKKKIPFCAQFKEEDGRTIYSVRTKLYKEYLLWKHHGVFDKATQERNC